MKITILKAKRIERGYKQEEFAKMTQIALRTYQSYENDGQTPTLINGIRISKKLELVTIKEMEQLFEVADENNLSTK